MTGDRVQRRLAAIMAADVVGYSRLMGADEAGTLARIKELQGELLEPKVAEYGGRIVKTTGDGFLMEFPSAVDAVQLAIDVQRALVRRNADVSDDRKIELRIGLNLGDVMVDGADIFGDGINVAARLEGLAEPGGILLSDMIHGGVRNKIDVAFEDLGDRSLKNIAEPVRVCRVVDDAPVSANRVVSEDAMFRRPAVAVLPFENLSGDPEQEYFADGLTEDIITALSLWRSFPVIARNSTFAYKGRSPDVREIGKELGARYVIEGSVRKAGNRIRVTAQLINTETGHHVWAERYDRQIEDFFDLQDDLAQRITATIAPELEQSEPRHLQNKLPENLDAWELVQRGYAHAHAFDRDHVKRALNYFEQSVSEDPGYARAHAGLAFGHHREAWLCFSSSTEASVANCVNAARRAVSLDETDSVCHIVMTLACFWTHEIDRSLFEAERAVELNPNNTVAYSVLGHALILMGRPDEAVRCLERLLLLNPRDSRHTIWLWSMAHSHFAARNYDVAVDYASQATQRQASNLDAYTVLAASLGHLGRLDEARHAFAAFDRLRSDANDRPVLFWRYKSRTDDEHFLDGLCKAGWEG